jgi:hypothetical protein
MLKVARTFTSLPQDTSARCVRLIPPTLKATPLAMQCRAQDVIVTRTFTSLPQDTSARCVRPIPPTLKATPLAMWYQAQGAIATPTIMWQPQGTRARFAIPLLRPTFKGIPSATMLYPQVAIATTISMLITPFASNAPHEARPVLQAQTLFLVTPCALAEPTGMFLTVHARCAFCGPNCLLEYWFARLLT